jgi:hypothetical protein
MRFIISAAAGLLVLAAAVAPEPQFTFEKEARAVVSGARSPKYLARRSHGLFMMYSAKGDLFFQSSSDVGDTFEGTLRINNVAGEVSDHGENSAQLLASPDEANLYAVWNARDPKDSTASVIRFSRSGAMRPSWSPAITVNDDNQPVSHAFQGAAVGPDGTIYVAWLDGRNRKEDHSDHGGHGADGNQFTGGTSDVYLSRSVDGGKTFEKNIRIAGNVCPCCRVSIAFVRGRVMIAWRQVEPGDLRDIYVAGSSDNGQTWAKPVLVSRDSWKIKGCPHCGPVLATLNDKLYVTWFTEGGGKPVINVASSVNGGESFSPKQPVSTGTTDPTHPQVAMGEGKIAITFQARDAVDASGWGKMAVYYREILSNGSMTRLVRAGQGKTGASYPGVALGMSGRIFLGWTETVDGKASAYLLRGRSADKGPRL